MITISYPIPTRGLGTDFAASERPITYAEKLVNRFINITGAAERRGGMELLVSAAVVPGNPNLTRIHEYVGRTGVETLFASDDNGNLYRAEASAWTSILTGKAPSRLLSIQNDGKLIFCNGVDRDFYTDDAGVSFHELEALINEGTTASPTDTTHLSDAQITNWLTETQISINDVVFNADASAYGVVTAVTAAGIAHTTIGTGGLGIGQGSINQAAGQVYRVIDTVAANIIPVGTSYDNVAIAGSGTSTSEVRVSGLNFATTTLVSADYIYNTTRAALTKITAVSANLAVVPITGQISGDSLVFLKSAMPITAWLHVNWGRTYYLDAKERTKVRISAKDDPRDLATFLNTLESSSFDFGSQQPQGDVILTMGTFQKYFVAGGKKYVYAFTGVDPVANTSAATVNFTPIAVYPQGLVSRFGLANTGNDLLFVSPDGLINATISFDSQNLISSNVSDVIKNTVRQQIAQSAPDDIQVAYYPRRNWIMMKIGSIIYNFNATPIAGPEDLQKGGTWSTFEGKFAQMNHYFVRRNGDLIGAGADGRVYRMDTGFTDDGTAISTNMVTSWYRLEEPQKSIRVKDGKYIKPIFESGGGVLYTIRAKAGFDNLASDQVMVTAAGGGVIGQFTVGVSPIGGTGVQTQKVPLRWRGEEVQLTITSESSAGPDVITGLTMYGNQFGRR
jgi:hypothetical protein